MLYHQKTDIFGRMMYYAFDKEGKGVLVKLPVKRIKEIIAMNRKGIIPPKANDKEEEPEDIKYTDGVGEESLSRFDEKKQKRRRPKNRNRSNNSNNNNSGNNENGHKENNNRPKIIITPGITVPTGDRNKEIHPKNNTKRTTKPEHL